MQWMKRMMTFKSFHERVKPRLISPLGIEAANSCLGFPLQSSFPVLLGFRYKSSLLTTVVRRCQAPTTYQGTIPQRPDPWPYHFHAVYHVSQKLLYQGSQASFDSCFSTLGEAKRTLWTHKMSYLGRVDCVIKNSEVRCGYHDQATMDSQGSGCECEHVRSRLRWYFSSFKTTLGYALVCCKRWTTLPLFEELLAVTTWESGFSTTTRNQDLKNWERPAPIFKRLFSLSRGSPQ